jgi:hypothetical protein
MRHVATNVQEEVVASSGHWLMEEKPEYTVALIRKFRYGTPTFFINGMRDDGTFDYETLVLALREKVVRATP